MTSELPPQGGALENVESDSAQLGYEFAAELTSIQYVIGRDICTYMPNESAAYIERFQHRNDPVQPDSAMPLSEVNKARSAYFELRSLFAQKIGYTASLDEDAGLYGFYCTRFSPGSLSLRKVIGDKQVDLKLTPNGPEIVPEIRVEDTRFIDHYRDWQSGKITDEELDERIELIKLEQNMQEIPFTSLSDVLHERTGDFLLRVVSRAHQTKEWFIDCRAKGIDPFDRSLWE